MMIRPPIRYADYTGAANPSLIFDAICKALSDRIEQVNWAAFTPADWQFLPQMARMERVGPLLYWSFKNGTCWPPGIPKETAAALMGQYYATLGQNALLFQELEKILEAFEQAEIPVVLLKGAALLYEHQDEIAQTAYAEQSLMRGVSRQSSRIETSHLEDGFPQRAQSRFVSLPNEYGLPNGHDIDTPFRFTSGHSTGILEMQWPGLTPDG